MENNFYWNPNESKVAYNYKPSKEIKQKANEKATSSSTPLRNINNKNDFKGMSTRDIQQFLVDNGFMSATNAKGQSNVDGKRGVSTNKAINDYLASLSKETRAVQTPAPVIVKRQEITPLAKIETPVAKSQIEVESKELPSFEEYMYRTGAMNGKPSKLTPLKRALQAIDVAAQYPLGILLPDRKAHLTEGGRRQMVAAAYNDGKITDSDHAKLGFIGTNSGDEFRKTDATVKDYVRQMMDSPYHNVFGQSSNVGHNDGFYPEGDHYDFNNQWRGKKVINVLDDNKGTRGTGSIIDAINEFKEARASDAGIKASMESAAAIRGVNGGFGNSAKVSNKQLAKYLKEYEDFLKSDKRQQEYFDQDNVSYR